MKLRNFLSWFASSVIAFVIMLLLINIVTGFFVDISMQRTLPLVIGATYDYASPAAQNQTYVTYNSLCEELSGNAASTQTRQFCTAVEQEQLIAICAKLQTLPADQQSQFAPTCQSLNDGSLQKSCEQKPQNPLSNLSSSCQDLNSGKMNTRAFIVGPLATVLYNSIQQSMAEFENSSDFENVARSQHINPNLLKSGLHYIQGQDDDSYLAVKIVSIILLFLLWFVVSHDLSDYLRSVSRMFFSAGMLVFATWLISLIIVTFFAPDTTTLLLVISGQNGAVQPSLTSLFMLLPVIVLELTSDAVLLFAAASICIAFLIYLLRKYHIDKHAPIVQKEEHK